MKIVKLLGFLFLSYLSINVFALSCKDLNGDWQGELSSLTAVHLKVNLFGSSLIEFNNSDEDGGLFGGLEGSCQMLNGIPNLFLAKNDPDDNSNGNFIAVTIYAEMISNTELRIRSFKFKFGDLYNSASGSLNKSLLLINSAL